MPLDGTIYELDTGKVRLCWTAVCKATRLCWSTLSPKNLLTHGRPLLLLKQVVMWCPKNNPIRALLGTLKGNQNPTNLKVYPAQEDQDGRIYVQL